MSRRRKPFDPAAQARALAERKIEDENVVHALRYGGEVNRDKAGRVTSIYRANVFNRLLEAKPTPAIERGHYDAAMWLVEAWAKWKGFDGGPDHGAEKVDCGAMSPDRRSLVTDRMISGGKLVMWALSGVGPMDRELLAELMKATVECDRPMEWREIVERVSGEGRRERQVSIVSSALENLRRHINEPVSSTRNGRLVTA